MHTEQVLRVSTEGPASDKVSSIRNRPIDMMDGEINL